MKKESGFSLLEVVMAVGILAIIVMMAINVLSQEMVLRQKITEIYPYQKIMNRIAQDISGAYLLPRNTSTSSDSSQGTPDSQNPENPENPQNPPSPQDSSSFQMNFTKLIPQFVFNTFGFVLTVINNRSLIRDSTESNIANIRYYQKKDKDKTALMRTVDTNMLETEPITLADVGISTVLVDDIKSFELEFWDGQTFKTDWDSQSNETVGKLPKMVKIKLTILLPGKKLDAPKKELPLEMIVFVRNAVDSKSAYITDRDGDYKWQ